jgi:DNA polymerase I-like protein with 3'-5' exonuclease and polymerase domains
MTLAINNKVYRTYEDFPSEDLYLYAGMDCIATSGLLSKLHQSITERPSYRKFSFSGGVKKSITTVRAPSVTDVMERYGNQFFEFIVDLEINGIKYDIPQNKEMGRRMVEEIGVLEDRLRPITGISLNFDSGPEVSNFLYNVKGYPVLDRTKTNEPSVDGDALISLAKHTGDVWLKDLAKHGDIVSVYRTFIRDYVNEFVKRDGRIHPTYNLHGTSSFRISGELPNLTQLPRPKHGIM